MNININNGLGSCGWWYCSLLHHRWWCAVGLKSRGSGFVRITGRIKELIITAGGENIPPVLIEVSQCQPCLAVTMMGFVEARDSAG